MTSKRDHAGWLMLDHRDSPGFSEAEMRKANPRLKPTAGKGLYETNVVHCRHCQKGLIVHPLLMADLPYCHLCDAYICESCKVTMAASGQHMPFDKLADLIQERTLKGLPPTITLERPHG